MQCTRRLEASERMKTAFVCFVWRIKDLKRNCFLKETDEGKRWWAPSAAAFIGALAGPGLLGAAANDSRRIRPAGTDWRGRPEFSPHMGSTEARPSSKNIGREAASRRDWHWSLMKSPKHMADL